VSENPYSSIFREELHGFAKLRMSRGYRNDMEYSLHKLDKYLVAEKISEKNLTPGIVDGWIASCGNGLTTGTVTNYVKCARKFAEYLLTLGISAFITDYPLSSTNAYSPYIFSAHEVENIFRVVDNMEFPTNPEAKIQLPMLLRLLYGCGLRLGEALVLKISNVDTETGVLHIFNAKGNKDRLVPMHLSLADIVGKYCLILTGASDNPFLFATSDGAARKRVWARTRFREVLTEAGITIPSLPPRSRNICLHCLRHTFAVHSLRMQCLCGIDQYSTAPAISVYLGHNNLMGTQKYLHMTAENSEDIWKITNALAKEIIPGVPR